MVTSTVGAITTRPTGNVQGGYYFISLSTGRRITRQEFTKLLMPSEVVDQVHQHAQRAKANKKKIRFTDSMNRDLDVLYAELEDNDGEDDPILQADGLAGVYNSDDDEDEDYITESDSDNESDDEDTNNAHDVEFTGSEIPGVEIPGVDNNTKNVNNHPTDIPGVDTEGVDNDNNHPTKIPGVDTDGVDNDNDEKKNQAPAKIGA